MSGPLSGIRVIDLCAVVSGFHLSYLMDPNDAHEVAEVERLNVLMVQRALRLGGTCTGEHGIGLHKMGYLLEEAGVGAVDMMRSIKRALDPLRPLSGIPPPLRSPV